MNLLMEEIRKYAGINVINEDIDTERIINAFRKYYKGDSNALNNSTYGNICYTKNNSTEKDIDDKGGAKLQISDLPECLSAAGIKQTGLLGLRELIRKTLTNEKILTNSNSAAFNSVFNMFAEKAKGNMNSVGRAELAKKAK